MLLKFLVEIFPPIVNIFNTLIPPKKVYFLKLSEEYNDSLPSHYSETKWTCLDFSNFTFSREVIRWKYYTRMYRIRLCLLVTAYTLNNISEYSDVLWNFE